MVELETKTTFHQLPVLVSEFISLSSLVSVVVNLANLREPSQGRASMSMACPMDHCRKTHLQPEQIMLNLAQVLLHLLICAEVIHDTKDMSCSSIDEVTNTLQTATIVRENLLSNLIAEVGEHAAYDKLLDFSLHVAPLVTNNTMQSFTFLDQMPYRVCHGAQDTDRVCFEVFIRTVLLELVNTEKRHDGARHTQIITPHLTRSNVFLARVTILLELLPSVNILSLTHSVDKEFSVFYIQENARMQRSWLHRCESLKVAFSSSVLEVHDNVFDHGEILGA